MKKLLIAVMVIALVSRPVTVFANPLALMRQMVAAELERASSRADSRVEWALPSIHIHTDLCPFEDRERWQDGAVSAEGDFYDVDARIRGRGNTTWLMGPDKRPLRIRFAEPRAMMGSSYEAADWILLANHFDNSLLRNYGALYLGGLMGSMMFTPVPHNVHLYVNYEYMGIYVLTDERDVNDGRMNLASHSDPELSEFFLELDPRAYRGGTTNLTYVIANERIYDIRYPGSSVRTEYHADYVREYLERVSRAIRAEDFEAVSRLIDIDSFVDFYIVQELFKNLDSYVASIFMHISGTGAERRLHKGPLWDFDISAGNAAHQVMGSDPYGLYTATLNYWYRHLMNTDEFSNAVRDRWNDVRNDELLETLERLAWLSENYRADFERNFARHNVLGRAILPTPEEILAIDTFVGHVGQLIDWLERRAAWLDMYFNGALQGYEPLEELLAYFSDVQPLSVYVDGQRVDFHAATIKLHDRIMLTTDEAARIFDAPIYYDEEAQTVTLEKGGDGPSIFHYVGSSYFTVNGRTFDFGNASVVIGGYAFIPIRIAAYALNHDISWDTEMLRVEVTTRM